MGDYLLVSDCCRVGIRAEQAGILHEGTENGIVRNGQRKRCIWQNDLSFVKSEQMVKK